MPENVEIAHVADFKNSTRLEKQQAIGDKDGVLRSLGKV
jgi:hypothetical protein